MAVFDLAVRDPRGEGSWPRLIAPALAAVLLTGIVVLAVQHYATLLRDPAARRAIFPAYFRIYVEHALTPRPTASLYSGQSDAAGASPSEAVPTSNARSSDTYSCHAA
jgi:hypothetical protein